MPSFQPANLWSPQNTAMYDYWANDTTVNGEVTFYTTDSGAADGNPLFFKEFFNITATGQSVTPVCTTVISQDFSIRAIKISATLFDGTPAPDGTQINMRVVGL